MFLVFCRNDNEILIRHSQYVSLSRSVHEMLRYLCDNVHERCSKVLTARAKVGRLDSFKIRVCLIFSMCVLP